MLLLILILSVLSAGSTAAPDRAIYLTDDDFARAKTLSSVGPNGTIFNPPHNEIGNLVRSRICQNVLDWRKKIIQTNIRQRNAWKHGTWPNARVPYTLDPKFDDNQRAEVARAFENYHSKTCVRFVPKQSTDNDYVEILRDDNTCGLAHICRNGGAQFAKFGGGCINSGTMSHELGHTLCMYSTAF